MRPEIPQEDWQKLNEGVSFLTPLFREFREIPTRDVEAIRVFVSKNADTVFAFIAEVQRVADNSPELKRFHIHDYREDLYTLQSGFDALRGRPDSKLVDQIRGFIRSSWFLIASAIESMQFFAKNENIASRELDSEEFYQDVEQGLKLKFGSKVDLKFDFDRSQRQLMKMNRGTIVTLLANMITNAIKHGKAKVVKVRSSFFHGGFKLSVLDDGQGFGKDVEEKIFDQGLGLNSGKTRMEWMLGDLKVEGHGGISGGAKFTMIGDTVPDGEKPEKFKPRLKALVRACKEVLGENAKAIEEEKPESFVEALQIAYGLLESAGIDAEEFLKKKGILQ